jgi:hypothetical protein
MYLRTLRAAILVMLSALAVVSTEPGAAAQQAAGKAPVSELWQPPDDIASRDLFHGPGGPDLAPNAETPFTWIATDEDGFSPGFDVRGPDGGEWSVKLGPEAQTEVVVSRILWAIGYHQPPTYYLERWTLTGGPGGEQPESRFRADRDAWNVTGDWAWTENPFVHTQPFRGLIVANVLLNSWDWKTSNNKVYEHADGTRRFVVRDVGASLGRTSSSRLLWLFPMRGFGQGTRNDLEGFEAAGFIESIGEDEVDFDFETIYGDVIDMVRPADVKWTAALLSRITDAQWDAAFRAGGYDSDARSRYIKKIKAKIAEGLAVS